MHNSSLSTLHSSLAVVGLNASGKTQLVEKYLRENPSRYVRYITFRDTYGGDNDRTYYLQQRWNQMEIDPETPTVEQLLEKAYKAGNGNGSSDDDGKAFKQHLYDIFNLHYLLDKYIILLSSGELRKFVLCRALMARPKKLIIDNPFIGLDKEAREQLKEVLADLSKEHGLQIVLILTKEKEVPPFITDIRRIENIEDREHLTAHPELIPDLTAAQPSAITPQPSFIVRLKNVKIQYGPRTILKDLNWTVRRGERWALSGQNGAGKSTLLSIICCDNPQSYANDVALFGMQRGHGESIWEIKKHIGYVSPEMHRSYTRDLPVMRIIASGLKDTIGLYVQPTEDDYRICRQWMKVFGIEHLAERSFIKLSSGEQRLVLVVRAFVKSPDLLILDEPLHGLDEPRSQMVKDIIDAYCQDESKTLIMVTHYEENLPKCITNKIELKRTI